MLGQPIQTHRKPQITRKKQAIILGGSCHLVVMEGYSCSEGHGFESQYCKLDGRFSQSFVVKL